MAGSNEDNWAKIRAGEGVTYGVAGCVPAAKFEIHDAKAITYFTWSAGKPPDGPMWFVFFEDLDGHTMKTFIPYGTLETILALAIDVAHGNDVEPRVSPRDAPGRCSGEQIQSPINS